MMTLTNATAFGKTYSHKTQKWTRAAVLRDGFASGFWKITPTDGSGDRLVEFLSAGSWSNNPKDDKKNERMDRIVLCDGPALPDWAFLWLQKANAKDCENAREAFRAAMDDTDDSFFGRDSGW